jgi:hypothetical protein
MCGELKVMGWEAAGLPDFAFFAIFLRFGFIKLIFLA